MISIFNISLIKNFDNKIYCEKKCNFTVLHWLKIIKDHSFIKNYLFIMSTLILYKQFFSVVRKQITQTRNQLHPNIIQAYLCLKSWLELYFL